VKVKVKVKAGTVAAALALAAHALPAAAQTPVTDARDTTHAQHQAPFFTRKDALLGLGFAAGTVAMFPLDHHIAGRLQTKEERTGVLNQLSTGVEVIASPGAYFIGGGLYIAGRIGGWERVADLGWHGTEAVFLAEGMTYVLKGLVGRQRPFLSEGKDPDAIYFARGFGNGDYQSFPSGHATTAFAAAAAVTNETTRWWPKSTRYVGPLMYGGATAVAVSRLYHNRHWASDVVMGAAIGTFTGRKVVQYAHGHPGNLIDRVVLRTAVVPDGAGGQMLMISLPLP
jgi:membrane-associated phospholipid phosphatase